jgi:hypothetical protein
MATTDNSAPKVSVIVPNYNHARFLRQRIDSILNQTFQDFEIILLDDASKDDSRSILSSYASDPRVRLEFNETNSGSPFKQWNKGVRLARGEYVWIAESDDYASDKLLERLAQALDCEATATFAYCRSWLTSATNTTAGFSDRCLSIRDPQRWANDRCCDGLEECQKYLIRVNSVPNASAVVFRRAVFEQVGGADESLRLCGDWKLWAAMALAGKVAYVAEPLNYFRCHGDTARNRSAEGRIDILEGLSVMRWLLPRIAPSEGLVEDLSRLIANIWVPAVMSVHAPFRIKREIMRQVWGIDPHPIKSAVRPALTHVRLKFLRHWRELSAGANSRLLR